MTREQANALIEDLVSETDRFWRLPKPWEVAREALLRAILALESDLGMTLNKPRPPVFQKPREPLRDSAWMRASAESFVWWDRLHAVCAGRDLSPERLGGAILVSAAMHDLLLDPAEWAALARLLATPDLHLKTPAVASAAAWIDLDLGDNQTRPWIPGSFTAGLLKRWLQTAAFGAAPDPGRLVKAMQAALWPSGGAPAVRNPKKFAEIAFVPLEDSGAPLPQALVETRLGRIRDTALHADTFEALWRRPQVGKSVLGPQASATLTYRPVGQRTPRRSTVALPDAERDIWQIIRAPKKDAKPISVAKARKGLVALSQSGLNDAPVLLCRWYAALLSKGGKVSSVRRYHVAAGKLFLTLAGDSDLTTIEDDALAGLFEQVIDLTPAAQEKVYAAATLAQFHRFGESDPAFLLPAADFDSGPGGLPSKVRAMVHSAPMFGGILDAINRMQGLEEEERDMFICAAILLYRGGLRIGEAGSLALAGVSGDAEGMIFLRNTRIARLKTDAARRNIPLGLVMTEAEAAWITQSRARRLAETSDTEEPAPFLAVGAGLFQQRFDADRFRRVLRAAARAVHAPVGLTPHGLRHSALSLLHLALMEDGAVVEHLTGWDTAQIRRIRRSLLGTAGASGNLYDALARFAGHAHAETTIINYLHLSDLIAGLRLAKVPERMDAQAAARSFATNAGAMPVQADGCVALDGMRPWLLSRLPARRISGGPGRRRGPVQPQPRITALTPRRAWQALSLRAGTPLPHIALATGVAVTDLAALFDRAEKLAALMTRKGRRRLIGDAGPSNGDWLPDRLWSAADVQMAVELCGHIRGLEREAVISWCIPALLDAERHHPGVRHYAPGTARGWIATAAPVIAPENWRVTLLLAAGDDADGLSKVWREGLGGDLPLTTERTQAAARSLTFARARVVNCRTDGTTAWPVVRSAAFLLAALDAPVFDAVIAADAEQDRRRRACVRDHRGTPDPDCPGLG